MEQPGTSKVVPLNDLNYTVINRLLNDELSDISGSEDEDVMDDSDADPDFVLCENDVASEEDTENEEFDEGEDDVESAVDDCEAAATIDRSLPPYVFGRLKKNESGPPFPWFTKSPNNQRVRTPAHNIIRGGLPGLTAESRRSGRPFFLATMTYKRFEVLLRCLRFDNSATRAERKKLDKAAPISEVFSKVIENSKKCYCLSEHATIDKMLILFRGRCGFRMYMPKKPHKYGIKVMCLADAKTSYLFDAYIYTGENSDGVGLTASEQTLSKPTQSVIRLTKSIQKTNRNITADNWFTSIEVEEELHKRGLTYVGTLKKDKKIIPTEFLPSSDRTINSSRFGFKDNYTLVSMVPKKNRAVLLLSTMHHNREINQEKSKPEIVCFYNSTKAGVDLLDMKCAIYSSNKRTRRWPMAVFYRLISVASVNAFILYMCYSGSEMMTRFQFTKELAQLLAQPHLQKRLRIPHLRRNVKEEIRKALGLNNEKGRLEENLTDRMEKRKTCGKCPAVRERKTQYKCIQCEIPVCSRKLCVDCAKDLA
ncbi:piggyBac transposable element-derived protein 4-like [Nilaparvata lugens]|uniref:piggyBac transposable element-derived protein 4-like n=1 Tax=Nilaparvata lugens TaxID=108931 RepID=UPI00193D12C6|nr:piggyBac transposable element-derived protein 4-like [Nilaparvata lugens]